METLCPTNLSEGRFSKVGTGRDDISKEVGTRNPGSGQRGFLASKKGGDRRAATSAVGEAMSGCPYDTTPPPISTKNTQARRATGSPPKLTPPSKYSELIMLPAHSQRLMVRSRVNHCKITEILRLHLLPFSY